MTKKANASTLPKVDSIAHQPKSSSQDLWQKEPETIKKFLQIRPDYQQLCAEVEYTLRKAISKANIQIAAILSRAKTLDSFLEKVERKKYSDPLMEMSDFAGVRVVCLYSTDIQKIVEIITGKFHIIEDNDKTESLGADKFGYGARHFSVRFKEDMSGARYDDLKHLLCEIQVRTVVQDAWAIIQHHMMYKNESQMPTQLQRKMNGLSGLFETVDDQFDLIKSLRENYLEKLKESSKKEETFLQNELNLDTLNEYLKWKFPKSPVQSEEGQIEWIFDVITDAELKSLKDIDKILDSTEQARKDLELKIEESNDPDSKLYLEPSLFEIAWAIGLTHPKWNQLLHWGNWENIVNNLRLKQSKKPSQ